MRLPLRMMSVLIKDRAQYPGRLMMDISSILTRCGILLLLYASVFRLNGGIINGTTFQFAAWSIFFYFAFLVLRLRDISQEIMQDIQTGNIEVLLGKPVAYLLYRMWWQIGSGIYSFLVIAPVATIVLAMIMGMPATMTNGFFVSTLLLTFVLGAMLSLLIYAIVGLLSFWMEDTRPLHWLVDKAVMILGGSYLPVALFPDFMYRIALYSPFGASQFVTHTVYASWAAQWQRSIVVQIFWILVLGTVAYVMFEKAKRRVSVNGG